MTNTLMLMGLITGGALVLPWAQEYLRRFQVSLVLVAALFMGLYCMAPYSSGARMILGSLNRIPQTLAAAASNAQDGMAGMSSTYFTAFHG